MTTTLNATTSNGLVATPDNSGDIALQSNGTTKLTVSSTGAYGQLVSGTAVSASGTSVDFTSIPSWVKRITVMFGGVSTNGDSAVTVQIGDSGGVEVSGYLGAMGRTGTGTAGANNSGAFLVEDGGASQVVRHGSIVLTLLNLSTNSWTAMGAVGRSDSANIYIQGGSKSLSAILDRVRITTVNGTDTFDAGTINILYEG